MPARIIGRFSKVILSPVPKFNAGTVLQTYPITTLKAIIIADTVSFLTLLFFVAFLLFCIKKSPFLTAYGRKGEQCSFIAV
jgi:hypothetical protein